MALWTHTKDPVGQFVEQEYGNHFEYSHNDLDVFNPEDWPHKVWVSNVHNQGFRFANVKKTVAYVVVNEDDHGNPVVQRWTIKNHRAYA